MSQPLSMFRYFLAILFISATVNIPAPVAVDGFTVNSYEPEFALLGDIQILNGDDIKLTGSVNLGNKGRMIYKDPIRLDRFFHASKTPVGPISFSTYFTFSIHQERFNGIDFVMVSNLNESDPDKRLFSATFHTYNLTDGREAGVENNVFFEGIDMSGNEGSVCKKNNGTDDKYAIESSDVMQAWIDYDDSSRLMEVRLSKLPFGTKKPINTWLGTDKPADPWLSYLTNLTEVWKQKEVFVGISASGVNSSQSCNVHSWSFSMMSRKYFSVESINSKVMLLGDAEIANGGASVKLTGSLNESNNGVVLYKHPIRFSELSQGTNITKPSSFACYFSFSVRQEVNNGLYLYILSNLSDYSDPLFSVEFLTWGSTSSIAGIDMRTIESHTSFNGTSLDMQISSKDVMHSWIDYDASSKRLELRLGKSTRRPAYPLVSFLTNLTRLWNPKEVFVGLRSSGVNSTQSCNVYGMMFRERSVPYWMHSQPWEPRFHNESHVPHSQPIAHSKYVPSNVCLLRVVTALVLGIGCGALASYIVLLFLRFLFVDRNSAVATKEYAVHPLEFGYEKLKLALEKKSAKAPTDEKK